MVFGSADVSPDASSPGGSKADGSLVLAQVVASALMEVSRPVELLFGHAPALFTKLVAGKLHGIAVPTNAASIAKFKEALTGEVEEEALAKIETVALQKEAELTKLHKACPKVGDRSTSGSCVLDWC